MPILQPTFVVLDYARLIALFTVLLYAAWRDHKTGEVSNKVWYYAPFGFVFMLIEYVSFGVDLLPYAFVTMGITVAVALGMFYMRHGWGGADSKALITLGVCYPLAPMSLFFTPFYPLIALWIGCMAAFLVMLAKRQKQIRFLPYLLIGFCVIGIV